MNFVINSEKYGPRTILIDDEDYEKVKDKTWHLSFQGKKESATIKTWVKKNGKNYNLLMPWVIMGVKPDTGMVKYRDGNRFNLTKNNLFVALPDRYIEHGFYMELICEGTIGSYSVLFDKEDFELVRRYKWRIVKAKNTHYAYSGNGRPNNPKISMHRLVMGFPEGLQVDHIKHPGTDNRKANLRKATHGENCMNRGISKNNTTGYKGVSVLKKGGYEVNIQIGGNKIHGGSFGDLEIAAKKYNELALIHHGEFASLNEIPPTHDI